MWRDALDEKIEAGQPAFGLLINSVEWVEIAAHVGFDWFLLDQMFAANDWGRTEELIRAGEAYGITPVVRMQSAPWTIEYDPRIAVDVSRAFGIGAQYVMVSNGSLREIEDAAVVSRDWHRKATTIHRFSNLDEWDEKIEELGKENSVIPMFETLPALDAAEEALAIPEVRSVFFSMTDGSKSLQGGSNRPDWYLPELWERVERAVEIARADGKTIGANTSYAYDLSEMQKRARRLYEAGVMMIFFQPAAFLFQVAIGGFLKDVRDRMRA
jgi:2-keto-3-deoxy-L-rhamnonate aldolase RhmA